MIIEDWIKGKVGFDISDLSISAILADRMISALTDIDTLSTMQKELCQADALMIYVTSPNKGSYKIQDGNSSETLGSEYFVDRDKIQDFAYSLYKKWGETPVIENPRNVKSDTQRW